MTVLGVIFGLYVLLSGLYLFYMDRGNRRERERLEDRLMAMSNQPALITHKALTDPEPAELSYVDGEKEFELDQNGKHDLLTDD